MKFYSYLTKSVRSAILFVIVLMFTVAPVHDGFTKSYSNPIWEKDATFTEFIHVGSNYVILQKKNRCASSVVTKYDLLTGNILWSYDVSNSTCVDWSAIKCGDYIVIPCTRDNNRDNNVELEIITIKEGTTYWTLKTNLTSFNYFYSGIKPFLVYDETSLIFNTRKLIKDKIHTICNIINLETKECESVTLSISDNNNDIFLQTPLLANSKYYVFVKFTQGEVDELSTHVYDKEFDRIFSFGIMHLTYSIPFVYCKYIAF